MKKNILFILITLLMADLPAQVFPSLNGVNYHSPNVGFQNPAPLVFIGRSHAVLGIQLLHTGLPGDNLRNNFLSYAHPLGDKNTLGLRAQYFTSDIFRQGNFSLMYSRKVYQDILAAGLNVNLLTYNYNQDNFFLFDFDDPLYAEGTGTNAISLGLGLLLQPAPGLLLGFSADHLNSPDISIDKSGLKKNRVFYAGATYLNLPVVPQVDMRFEGDESLIQGGVRKILLQDKLGLFAGFQKFGGEGNGVFGQLEFNFGDLGVLYNFQTPVTGDLMHISNGTHQIGLFYTKGKSPSLPDIILGEFVHDPHLPELNLLGKATNSDGLKYIEIRNNDVVQKRIECVGNPKSQDIKQTVLLQEGRNRVEIEAYAAGSSRKERILVSFEPLPPVIDFLSEVNQQLADNQYQMKVNITDPIGVDKIQIYQNDIEIKRFTDFTNNKNVVIAIPAQLTKGENSFKVFASNKWKNTKIESWLVYKPLESPPELKIDSPQKPVSSSSTIIVNIELDNYRNVQEIIIKVNGEIVDTVRVAKMKGFSIGDRPSLTTSSIPVNLPGTENIIEAIVIDKENQPRASRMMKVLYNPYAQYMDYDKKTAIIIGINKYEDERIPDLDLAVSDADTMKNLLKNYFGFDEIYTVFNADANFQNIRNLVSNKLYQAGKNDLIIVYYSGHGNQVVNAMREEVGYLIPSDAQLNTLANNISMSYINEIANQSPARDILFIIDACYSGLGIVERPSFIEDFPPGDLNFERLNRQVVRLSRNIISAGGKRERAVDGLFTRVLKNGLKGAADYNNDEYITSTELGFYLKKHVSEDALRRYKREQNPQYGSFIPDKGDCILTRKR